MKQIFLADQLRWERRGYLRICSEHIDVVDGLSMQNALSGKGKDKNTSKCSQHTPDLTDLMQCVLIVSDITECFPAMEWGV